MQPVPITYREFTPDSRLKDYIKAYWYFNIRTNSLKPIDILPDGCFDLLIIIQNKQIVNTRLTGVWNQSVTVNYTDDTEVIGIRFKPLSIGSLFNFEVEGYVNQSMDFFLYDIHLNSQIILDSLSCLPDLLVSYLNACFLKILLPHKTDLRLKKCFDLVEASTGCVSVKNISDTIGLSTRQLHRHVTRMIGIGLKDYAKIIRFKNTLSAIRNNPSDYQCYYDQSHFIRDVKQFTGLTPDKLALNENDRFVQYYDFLSL